jgi:tetratricopeptide (TPR) repeat protein
MVRLSALRILLRIYQTKQRYAEAILCVLSALRVARDLKDEPSEASILDIAGDVYLAMGDRENALSSYEQSLDLYQRLGAGWAGLVVKQDIGRLYQAHGEWDAARTWLQACLLEEERAGQVVREARLCYELACLHTAQGELDLAAGLLYRSRTLFRRVQDKRNADQVGRTLMGLGVLMYRQATAGQMTFQDIQRGVAQPDKEHKG